MEMAKISQLDGRYPLLAFLFVQEAISKAMKDAFGEMSPAQMALAQIMGANNLDSDELIELRKGGKLTANLERLMDQAGELKNRHVGGGAVCKAAQALAIERWGMMAPVVLSSWNITRTIDFGHIVFAMVDTGMLGKQPEDVIEDFQNIYDFDTAFEVAIASNL